MKILTERQLNAIITRELQAQSERHERERVADNDRRAYWELEGRVTALEQRVRALDALDGTYAPKEVKPSGVICGKG